MPVSLHLHRNINDVTNNFPCRCLVRLVGSNMTYSGRLEVSYNGVWGTVCDDNFGDVDAGVFCYRSGFG